MRVAASPGAGGAPSGGTVSDSADATVAYFPESRDELAAAAAAAEVVHLSFSARIPTVGGMTALVTALDLAVAAAGRSRETITVLLEVDVVLAADEAAARRSRDRLAMIDAFAGVGWLPSATRVVGTAETVVAAAARLAEKIGADGVVLVPLAAPEVAEAVSARLRALAR